MVNSHFIKILLGKQSFHKVFSHDSYDWLKFHIFAWLGLNPNYAPVICDLIIFGKRKLVDISLGKQVFSLFQRTDHDSFLPITNTMGAV